MKVKQFIKVLEKLEPEALVMVATYSNDGEDRIEMVEARIEAHRGDAEVYPEEEA